MNEWVRQRISGLREHFYNASHWVRQPVHWWISMQRERFYNAPQDHQVLMISSWLIMLSLPLYLFVPISRIVEITPGIFVGTGLVYYLWHDRYPALKRWIREIEYGENDGKDPHCEAFFEASAQRPRLVQAPDDADNEELLPSSPIGRRVFRILGRIFSKWQSYQLSKWQSLQLFERLYVLTFMMLIVGLVFFRIHGSPTTVFYGFFLPAYGVSSIGFGIWLWPWLQRIWHWRHGKLALTLLHGGILLLSIIPARELVAEALGLPPQDFDVTVALCIFLFYIPIWVFVFVLLVMAFTLIRFILSGLGSFASYFPLNALVMLIAKVFPVGSRSRLFLEQNINKFVWHGFMHMLGVMPLVFGVMFLGLWFSPVITRLQPIVRVVAYFADFQPVSLYPGVDANRRLRLHENGVVSYAEKRGWDVVISVEKVQ